MKLINKLILGIFSIVLITNILVLFDIQYFYIRAIFSLCTLIIVPGLLIMLILNIKKVGFWEYVIYTIGLSITFLMFGGLAVNWILPWIHITDKPLSTVPLLISFDILLSIFAIFALLRNKDKIVQIKLPKFELLDKIFLISPIVFPILSVMGAISLNNKGSNFFTMLMFGVVAIYILLTAIFHDKLNKHIYPWSIVMISSAILLSGWLRSWYISGIDINLEYHIFQLIREKQIWNMSIINHAYNSCLSISIFPTILSSFLKINDHYIFKLVIPAIFSFTPLVLYLIFKNYISSILSFISALFFIIQPMYLTWWQIPIRQELAFLFFAISILILFNKRLSFLVKNILFIAFCFSMIVSHYSTSYISLILYSYTYMVVLVIRVVRCIPVFSNLYNKINVMQHNEMHKKKYNLNILTVIFPLIFSFFWFFVVTNTSGNLVGFANKSIKNLSNIFNTDIRAEGASLQSQWNIFYIHENNISSLDNVINNINVEYGNKPNVEKYSKTDFDDYNVVNLSPEVSPQNLNREFTRYIYIIFEFIKKIVKIFLILGIIYLLFNKVVKSKIDIEFLIISVGSLFIIIAMLILPFASLDYSIARAYQQTLVILCLPTVLGCYIVFYFIRSEKLKITTIAIIFLLLYLFQAGFIPQIVGGTIPTMQLNNNGTDYNKLFIHKSEIDSSKWLLDINKENLIYTDNYSSYKFLHITNIEESKLVNFVFPSIIGINSYVYSSYTNTVKDTAFININGNTILYNYPSKFLSTNKNIIYSNGDTYIYK